MLSRKSPNAPCQQWKNDSNLIRFFLPSIRIKTLSSQPKEPELLPSLPLLKLKKNIFRFCRVQLQRETTNLSHPTPVPQGPALLLSYPWETIMEMTVLASCLQSSTDLILQSKRPYHSKTRHLLSPSRTTIQRRKVPPWLGNFLQQDKGSSKTTLLYKECSSSFIGG